MLGCAGVRTGSGTGGAGGGGGAGGAGATTDAAAPPPPPRTTSDARPSSASDALPNCTRELRAVVRDFRSGEKDGQPKHPDFEYMVAIDKGIVAATLGPDSKPVYAGGTAGTTTSQANFDQWYRDVEGINIHFDKTIPLTPDATRPGVFVYDSDLFYPIDDEGWGNQYLQHNYDFTTELHFTFPYKGGEVFTFRGDDDLFLFVNGRLAVDLGGVHSAQTGTVDMDARAAELGLETGKSYRMDIFQAERHCCDSTFHLETTLQCIDNIIVP